MRELAEQLGGAVDVLHFTLEAFREKDPIELPVAELLDDVALGAGALLTVVQAARPTWSRGAASRSPAAWPRTTGGTGAASLGVQEAGVRNLVRGLDAILVGDDIRAVSVTVRGTLSRDADSPFHPDRVAQALQRAAQQREDRWRTEVPHVG